MPIYSPYYSTPYIILIIIFIINGFLESKKNKSRIIIIDIIIFILFFGFRGYIGADWENYYHFFENITSIKIYETNFEPGYYIYNYIINIFSDEYVLFTIISSTINITFLTIFFNRCKIPISWGIAIYICMMIIYETNLMRNAKSYILFLYSLQYIIKKQFNKYFVINLIGILFHKSSIIFIPLYFILNNNYSRKKLIIIYSIGCIFYLCRIPLFLNTIIAIADTLGGSYKTLVDFYTSVDFYMRPANITLGFIMRTLLFSLTLCYYEKLTKNFPYGKIAINSLLIYNITFLYFWELFEISVRIGGMFLFSYCILIPYLYESISIKSNKIIYSAIIWMYMTFFLYKTTSSIMFDYDNIISGSKSYEERLQIQNSVQKDIYFDAIKE